MKLPTCLWMLGAGVFPSVTSAHAQRIEDIIELNAEFNENGDYVEKQRIIYLYPMWMAVYARFGRLARKA